MNREHMLSIDYCSHMTDSLRNRYGLTSLCVI